MEAEITFVPKDFYCPITGELMKEPVLGKDGHSYEKSEILRWLSQNSTSPMTREPLREEELVDNLPLKRSIEEIRDRLKEEQLKIESLVSEEVMVPFISALDEIKLNSYYLDNKLFVNIDVPTVEQRPPVDIVLCIDVSYSMFDEATLKGDSNETIGHGFSVLSLTVSAAKTILHSLNGDDNVSIVTYSGESRTICSNVACTPENRSVMEIELDGLKPISNTNMWAGIHTSLDILRTTSPPSRVKGIFLLTDGIPNVDPPRGHEYMLEKYFRDHDFKCMISCYGFGYNLQSELLLNLSNISGGDGFSFIPDASLLGNIFIHGISNLLTTALTNVDMKIQLSKDIMFRDVQNGKAQELDVKIDSLKYGQSKNFIFQVNTSRSRSQGLDYLNDFAEVSLNIGGKVLKANENPRPPRDYYLEQKFRHETIDTLNNCINLKKYNDPSIERILNRLIDNIQREGGDNVYLSNILFDLTGQVKEALNWTTKGVQEDWFSRWGIHYLRSLQDAYRHELCNNFKDKGVSNFSGELFNQIRDQVSDTFDSLPPPKRDVKSKPQGRYSSQGCRSGVTRQAVPTSMSAYNTASGGCCAEGCRVLMADDNDEKNVEDIKKGDKVITYHMEKDEQGRYHESHITSTIECVIRTKCENNKETMVQLGNLLITPYHPIIDMVNYEKDWSFPIKRGTSREHKCNYMYTFVTSNRHSLVIERYIFATFGHGLKENIVSHDYFGTESIINDLKKFPTYEEGYVNLTKNMIHRDENGLVSKIE